MKLSEEKEERRPLLHLPPSLPWPIKERKFKHYPSLI